MRRALRAFSAAAGTAMQIDAAPMGLARGLVAPALEWLPSTGGFRDVRELLRELAGLSVGA